MKLKITKGRLIWSIFKSVSLLVIILYSAIAYYTVSNRMTSPLANTAWLSNKQDELVFIDDIKGVWIEGETRINFVYESKNGYVLCHLDEELLLELIEIEDHRLFSVNTNNMYYNEAYL